MKIYSIICAALISTSIVGLSGCGIVDRGVEKYDTLVTKDEQCTEAWANIDANLTRRADMIPNLIATVKGSAAHEEKVLKEVIEARASATQIKMSPADFEDPAKMAAFQKAQDDLKGSLSRLMMVQESYPDLKANAQFHDLMISIEGTENRLLRAREEYNRAVKEFNVEVRRVSGKVMNPLTGHEFRERVYYSASAAEKEVPKVNFDPTPTSVSK